MRELQAPSQGSNAIGTLKHNAVSGPAIGDMTTGQRNALLSRETRYIGERRSFISESSTDTASARSKNDFNREYDWVHDKDADEDQSSDQNVDASILRRVGMTTKLGIGTALFLQLATIVVLLVITFKPIYIRTFGLLGFEKRTLYVVGTTLAVSAVFAFTVGQVRQLWLEHELSRPVRQKRIGSARVILGISTLREKAQNLQVVVSFLVTGFFTSAVVAAFVPNVVTTLRNVQTSWTPSDDGIVCMATTNSSIGSEFEWRLQNGSFYSLNTTRNDACASQRTEYAVSALLDSYAELYAYTVNGIPVDRWAIGTPYSNNLYGSGGGFYSTFNVEGAVIDGSPIWSLFQWSTACLPVFVQNPWKCHATGNVIVGKNELTVLANDCNITRPIFGVDMKTQGATAAGACTHGKNVGQATIVIGAVNDHAAKLKDALGGYLNSPPPPSYSVACTVDIEPALGFRLVNFSRFDSNIDGQSDPHVYAFQLAGGGECTPVSSTGKSLQNATELYTQTQLAQAASAPWQLLTENAYNDGWWSQLWQIVSPTLRYDYPDAEVFTFNNSANALEDSFGLVSSIMASYNLGYTSLEPTTIILSGGTVAVTATRIGSGSLWSLFYIVPELFAVSLILYLLWERRKINRSPSPGFPAAG